MTTTDTSHAGRDMGMNGRPGGGGRPLRVHRRLALHRATERLISRYFRTVRCYCGLFSEGSGPERPAPRARRSLLPPRAGRAALLALVLAHVAGLLSLDQASHPMVIMTFGALGTVIVGATLVAGRVAADLTAAPPEDDEWRSAVWAASLLLIACIVSGALGARYSPGSPAETLILGLSPLATAAIESRSTHPLDRADNAVRRGIERKRRRRLRRERRTVRAVHRWGRAHRSLARSIESSARAGASPSIPGGSPGQTDACLLRSREVLSALTPDPRVAAKSARVISNPE